MSVLITHRMQLRAPILLMSVAAGTLQYQLLGYNVLQLQVICMTVRLEGVGTNRTVLRFAFADDKMQFCNTVWDTSVSAYSVIAGQQPYYCPSPVIDSTGLIGWGKKTGASKPYIGYTSRGYWWVLVTTGNTHWTTTTCIKNATLVPVSASYASCLVDV